MTSIVRNTPNMGGVGQNKSSIVNRRLVFDLVWRFPNIDRKAICEQTGLSPQAVANITGELEQANLVQANKLREQKSRGQPPIGFRLNPNGGQVIGVSLVPGRATAALVNLQGQIIETQSRQLSSDDADTCKTTMFELVQSLAGDSADLWGVGISLPGPLNIKDFSAFGHTSFHGWRDLSIFDDLSASIGLPCVFSTDSIAGATGELLYGQAQNLNNFYYLHFGLGLGGVQVDERKVLIGSRGNATEVGHMPIVEEGRQCPCGNTGCLETVVSLDAFTAAFGTAQLKADKPEHVDWFESSAQKLKVAICMLENMLDPQAIVIGGTAPKAFTKALYDQIFPLLPSVCSDKKNRVLLSAMGEDCTLRGAAALLIKNFTSSNTNIVGRYDSLQSNYHSALGIPKLQMAIRV